MRIFCFKHEVISIMNPGPYRACQCQWLGADHRCCGSEATKRSSKLISLSPHLTTTTNTAKQFVIFWVHWPAIFETTKVMPTLFHNCIRNVTFRKARMFHTFKGPGESKAETRHDRGICKIAQNHFMTPLVILAERNLYEIAKFTRTQGWDDDNGRNAPLVDPVFLEDVAVDMCAPSGIPKPLS